MHNKNIYNEVDEAFSILNQLKEEGDGFIGGLHSISKKDSKRFHRMLSTPMTDDELQKRYDRIKASMEKHNVSRPGKEDKVNLWLHYYPNIDTDIDTTYTDVDMDDDDDDDERKTLGSIDKELGGLNLVNLNEFE